jgi:hypothetical protein
MATMSELATEPARGSAPSAPCPGAGDAVRAFGVVFGGPVVLDVAAVASVVATARALARRRRPPATAAAGVAAAASYALAVRPWMRRWGATPAERARALPGDELVPRPGAESTRAVTIDAPVEEVWPWLAQLGQDRGGFYSYEWLENIAGCRMRNADRIHDEWQHREAGEKVMLHWGHGTPVTLFERDHVLALKDWGSFVVEPAGDGRTRLIARGRTEPGLAALMYVLLVEIPHFVMERSMLLGIKRRAEAARGGGVR